MCQKVLLYILNNKKLDWLEKKKPNPYALAWDKIDYIFGLIFISILGILSFFAKEIPCPIFLITAIAILFFLSIVRHIKTIPADSKQAITKPLICYQLILSSFILVFSVVQIVSCLKT